MMATVCGLMFLGEWCGSKSVFRYYLLYPPQPIKIGSRKLIKFRKSLFPQAYMMQRY